MYLHRGRFLRFLPNSMFVLGHRGAPEDHHENTLSSLRSAVEQGADGVELDVRLTLDGHLVVHHDPSPSGGIRAIERSTLEQVRSWRLPGGENIPTLAEVLDALPRHVRIVVELKGRRSAVAIPDVLRRDGPRCGLRVSSFNHAMLARLAGQGFALAVTADRARDLPGKARALGACEVHLRHDLWGRDLLCRCRDSGLAAIAWTVDDPRDILRCLRMGLDGVITNRVRAVLQLLKSEQPLPKGNP